MMSANARSSSCLLFRASFAMTVATVQFVSVSLWRAVTYTAIFPDRKKVGSGPYPVLLQLHGGNQSHTDWLYYSHLPTYARTLPFIIVLPDGAQSRWANGGPPFTAYEDFLIGDLSVHVRDTFPAWDGPWAISGNSMGGFGAVRLGLKYPNRLCSVWSHSACFPTADALPEHWYWTGNADDLDCYKLVDQLDPQTIPRLSFDCGTDDHLLADNRRFHRHLTKQGIPHAYHEHRGGHDWAYWDEHIPEALAQHHDEFKKL